MNLKGRDWIATQDWAVEEIQHLVDRAGALKKDFKAGRAHRLLPDKTIFLFFFDKSTRTRNSFEAGITQLGGHAHFIEASTSQIAHGESPKDTGIILSSYGHGIAVRHDLVPGEGNTYLREVATWATVPVINMQCDVDHPCQTLADLMTIQELFGRSLRGLKVAVTWAHPPGYELMEDQVKLARHYAAAAGSRLEIVDDMDAAFADADVVYPKSWGALDCFDDPMAGLARAAEHEDWICDERRLGLARPNAWYMHCLPADRGHEVTDAVIDGPQSAVYRQAENRLHTCKAIMAETM